MKTKQIFSLQKAKWSWKWHLLLKKKTSYIESVCKVKEIPTYWTL